MTSETRSDALPAKRDEVAAQLRHLADLVERDRWEDAGRCMDVVKDGFMTCFAAWNKLRMQRSINRFGPKALFAGVQAVIAASKFDYEGCATWTSEMEGHCEQLEANRTRYGFRANPRSIAP
jgi:hypothetical protein